MYYIGNIIYLNEYFYSNFPLNEQIQNSNTGISTKLKKMGDQILPQIVKDLVPESQAYMNLLTFEKKLNFTIMRKRLDMQVIFLK